MTRVQELINELIKEIDLESNIEPRRDRVLVQELHEDKSDLLWTPDEKSNKGIVVATGPGHVSPKGVRIPTGLERGDMVLFNKHVGETVELNGKKARFIKASDILMKVV